MLSPVMRTNQKHKQSYHDNRLDWDIVLAGGKAGGLQALPALLSRLPDVERGITRILHRTASPAEFVTTMRALAGVGSALRLAEVDVDGRIVVDASLAQSTMLRQLLEAAASPEVSRPNCSVFSLLMVPICHAAADDTACHEALARAILRKQLRRSGCCRTGLI